jgi:flagellar protein FliT
MAPPDDGHAFRTHGGPGPAALIRCYETIADASRRMLGAARADDWDEVARLEARCRELIAELRMAARTQRLGAAEQRRRVELLRGILADDAEMRVRSEPWLRQLERLIAPRAPRRAARD